MSETRQAGLRIFVILYGDKLDDNLTKLRYAHYMNLVATSKHSNLFNDTIIITVMINTLDRLSLVFWTRIMK